MEHAAHDTPPVCDYCGRPAEYVTGQVGEDGNDLLLYTCSECEQELQAASEE